MITVKADLLNLETQLPAIATFEVAEEVDIERLKKSIPKTYKLISCWIDQHPIKLHQSNMLYK